MILALKTADSTTEMYLLDDNGKVIADKIWQSERRLAHDLLGAIESVIASAEGGHPAPVSQTGAGSRKKTVATGDSSPNQLTNQPINQLTRLIVFTGPGSFTGLRIGITTMNSLAYGLDIPIVGVNGEKWIENGLQRLNDGENDRIITPHYGAEANITSPRK